VEDYYFMTMKKKLVQNDEISEKEMHEKDTEDKKENGASEIEEKAGNKKAPDEAIEEPSGEPEQKRDETELKSASEYLEHLQRLQAEFTNYKKRVQRERLEFTKFVKSEFIKKLLPVVDDFERLITNHNNEPVNNKDTEDFTRGSRLIYEKLMTLLKNEGVVPIDSEGKDFDPNLHEALMMEITNENSKDGKVLEEWEKGYMFDDNILRVAKVKVGKYNPESGDNEV